jgi:hypothetical protein
MGIAYFVAGNRESVLESVQAVHDLEDAGEFYQVDAEG